MNGQAEIRTELDAQIDLLAAMFDDAGLSALRRRLPSHPAVTRYDALVALRDSSVSPDNEHGLIKEVAWALMDRRTWAANPSVRPFWETSVPEPRCLGPIPAPGSRGSIPYDADVRRSGRGGGHPDLPRLGRPARRMEFVRPTPGRLSPSSWVSSNLRGSRRRHDLVIVRA